jgi:hypothetical protein
MWSAVQRNDVCCKNSIVTVHQVEALGPNGSFNLPSESPWSDAARNGQTPNSMESDRGAFGILPAVGKNVEFVRSRSCKTFGYLIGEVFRASDQAVFWNHNSDLGATGHGVDAYFPREAAFVTLSASLVERLHRQTFAALISTPADSMNLPAS